MPKETIIARGKICQLVQWTQPDGQVFEAARRAPGARLIIADRAAGTVLLTREFRHELQAWDYRLPGGKVFDRLADYEAYLASGADMLAAAAEKAKGEGAEEAGVDIAAVELYRVSTLGATMVWDLYIFEATAWQPHADGQQLEVGEQIEADTWLPYTEAEAMILGGDMREERVALTLLQWLYTQRHNTPAA